MAQLTFIEYVTEWIEKYGTQGKLAGKIGLTESAFSRGLKHEGTFGMETLLRFIKETGEPAGKVLRLAGKSDLAELLEDVYGEAGPALSGPHREVIELWDEIPHGAKPALLTVLKGLAGRTQSVSHTRRRSSSR